MFIPSPATLKKLSWWLNRRLSLKVKKYRVMHSLPVVGKILMSLLSTKKMPAEIEESLPLDIQAATAHLMPTAFYRTWTQGEIPAAIDKILSDLNQDKAIAVSIVAATVGSPIEEKIAESLMKGETNRSHVLAAIG